MPVTDILKTSRPGVKNPTLIPKFQENPKLCVYNCIKTYIEKTESLRGNNNKYLFLSIIEPFKSIGAQTIARWIKTVMSDAGIDVSIFKSHSTRHASTSAALLKGVDLETIKNTAGWSEKSKVFAKFYNRPILKQSNNFISTLFRN